MPRGKRSKAQQQEEEDSSSSSSASSSSAESIELDLGEDGRINVPGLVVKPFRSFSSAIAEKDIASLIPDAQAVFTARATKKGAKYSAGNTFWLAANEKPQCALEVLAREIFTFHSAGATFDPLRSGAEWWTQVLQPDDSIGFHWDKDYPLEEGGLNLCPAIGTVTYFSNIGGGTLVLEKPAPPLTGDPLAGLITRAFLSRPVTGKHMSFDGYFLHGAPSSLVDSTAPPAKEKLRVTFLVNVWLNHKPTNSIPLPAALRKKLSTNAPKMSFAAEINATITTEFSDPQQWSFTASENTSCELVCPIPKCAANAVEMQFPADMRAELRLATLKATKKQNKKTRNK